MSHDLKICVIGMGYVGLPLAIEFESTLILLDMILAKTVSTNY